MPEEETLHKRTCRYGHGPLDDEGHAYYMRQFGKWEATGVVHAPGDPVFALRISVCRTCGYVELFDTESIRRAP